MLSAALTFATFYVLVALGQMFVVTLGPGNVDLSIPACMTLAGTVAMKVMHEANALILPGLALAAAIGVGVGVVNYALIRFLRIPPIIATLSSSFVFQSAAIWYNRGLRIKPPPTLADFTTAMVGGVPMLALVVLGLSVVAASRSDPHHLRPPASSPSARTPRAARLAGVPVERTRALTYVMCAVLAASAATSWPASPAARRSTWARSTSCRRSPSS